MSNEQEAGFYYMRLVRLISIALILCSCINKKPVQEIAAQETKTQFDLDLEAILSGDDPYLWILVDKNHALPSDYEPQDLVKLTGTNKAYRINRNDMFLREPAEIALEEMAKAAKADGLTLVASSAYRSYAYQDQLYARYARQYGQQEADTFSARPGHSQHQLGLVVDFGSITDAFADTAEGKWLAANALRYGWSLSYPKDYEDITGYKWECWHYRYVGKELAAFIDTYFDGIQQHALEYINSCNSMLN